MKKNNKGFTVVEMGISFCLIFVICILLFQIILSLKEIYISSDIKTTILNKQGILLNKIYHDFYRKGIISVKSCATNCIEFSYNDNSTSQLIVNNSNKTITYDDYTWKLDNASTLSEKIILRDNVGIYNINGYNNYFQIIITINNKLLNLNYDLNIVYQK